MPINPKSWLLRVAHPRRGTVHVVLQPSAASSGPARPDPDSTSSDLLRADTGVTSVLGQYTRPLQIKKAEDGVLRGRRYILQVRPLKAGWRDRLADTVHRYRGRRAEDPSLRSGAGLKPGLYE